jgi:hypothetical protein
MTRGLKRACLALVCFYLMARASPLEDWLEAEPGPAEPAGDYLSTAGWPSAGSLGTGVEAADTLPATGPMLPTDTLDEYGLSIVVPPAGFSLGKKRGDRPSPERVRSFLATILPELLLFPAPCIRAAGLREIALVENLRVGGDPYAGMVDQRYKRIWFDVADEKSWRRVVFYHEIYHAMRGQLGVAKGDWADLNPPGFLYSRGYERLARSMDDWRAEVPGFVDVYSKSTAEEDQANVFATVLSRPTWGARKAGRDDVFARKYAYMKRAVSGMCSSLAPAAPRSSASAL